MGLSFANSGGFIPTDEEEQEAERQRIHEERMRVLRQREAAAIERYRVTKEKMKEIEKNRKDRDSKRN